jgi:hypothetical protein
MRATAPTEPAKIATSGISRQHDRDAWHYTVANQRESPPPDATRRDLGEGRSRPGLEDVEL